MCNHFLKLHATDAVITKTNEEICKLTQCTQTQWDVSLELWDLSSQCRGVYNEQKQRQFVFKVIDLIIRSIMCPWWVDNQEVALEDLMHQALSSLDLQCSQYISVTKEEVQWTPPVRRTNKEPKSESRNSWFMEIQDDRSSFSSSINASPSRNS